MVAQTMVVAVPPRPKPRPQNRPIASRGRACCATAGAYVPPRARRMCRPSRSRDYATGSSNASRSSTGSMSRITSTRNRSHGQAAGASSRIGPIGRKRVGDDGLRILGSSLETTCGTPGRDEDRLAGPNEGRRAVVAVCRCTVPLFTSAVLRPGMGVPSAAGGRSERDVLHVERRRLPDRDDRDRCVGRALGHVGALDVALPAGWRRPCRL